VIVDASASLPPRRNLQRFIAEGADLVVYSGGKAIGGPQASGILAGRADLVASAALQHLDMDVRQPTWTQREHLAVGTLRGIPHQGLGRAMKVGREEIAGLVTALRIFIAGSDEDDLQRWQCLLDHISGDLHDRKGLVVRDTTKARQPVPQLMLDLDPDRLGFTAYDAINALLDGEPSVAVGESYAEFGTITINPMVLNEAEADIVRKRLAELFS
jgi:L-seryl-tRNA(Ser) seleniumtransferase